VKFKQFRELIFHAFKSEKDCIIDEASLCPRPEDGVLSTAE